MLEVCPKPCSNRRCRSTHDRTNNSDNAILVHSALRTHKSDSGIGVRVLEDYVHLALEVSLFVGEERTLHSGGTEFGKIAGKRSKHEHGRKTGAETFKSADALLGGLLQILGRSRLEDLLVPVSGSAVTLGVLAFAAKLELHPTHHFAINGILFKQSLKLVCGEEGCGQSLNGDIFSTRPCSRVGRIRKHAEHGFDTIEHGALFDINNSAGKLHSFAVGGLHMVFQEAGCHVVSIILFACTQITFGKHHRSLFAFNLAERGAVNLLQRCNCIRAATVLDHRLYAFNIILRKNRGGEDCC